MIDYDEFSSLSIHEAFNLLRIKARMYTNFSGR